MTMSKNIITINNVEYIPLSEVTTLQQAEKLDGLDYVIVRTYSAGVFAGYISKRDGKEATILQARRLWYWTGAASLSQLAVDGTSSPNTCKFPCEVASIDLTEVIEVLSTTEKAKLSINAVPIWQQ